MKRKKGFYSISVVAKMFSVHQQTIRMYEKEGLITPKRTEGNTRLFAEEDVDRLEQIIHLTHKLGVNLAGVEIILRLEKRIKLLQDEMNKMFSQVQGQLQQEGEKYKEEVKQQSKKLLDLKQEGNKKLRGLGPIDVSGTSSVVQKEDKKSHMSSEQSDKELDEDFGDWEIEYDESD